MYEFISIVILLFFNKVLSFPGLINPKLYDQQLYLSSITQGIIKPPVHKQLWFNQTIDHFNDSELINPIFQQRYFMNPTYYKPGGPALLYIGGESELDGLWTELSILTLVAKQLGGIVYGLEHRYYGKSQPTEDWSYKNLKYLTSQQAISDIANFVQNVDIPRTNIDNRNKTKWVVAGGSYAGNLAAWTRLKHPDLIVGAVASSAPVEAKLDFFEYDLGVQKSVLYNAGPDCLNYYSQIFEHIDATLNSENLIEIDNLKTKFNFESEIESLGFTLALNSFLPAFVQYNNNNYPTNLRKHCQSLKVNSTIDQKLVEFSTNFIRLNCTACIPFANPNAFKDTKIDFAKPFRPFLYQLCNEFGYWQLAPPSSVISLRSRIPTIESIHKTYCQEIFSPELLPNTDLTNSYYKAKQLKISNVVFNNGELDPWSTLSILPNDIDNNIDGMLAYKIDGAAHVSDLNLPNSYDSKSILEAKNRSIELVKKWLKF